jgi:hypothetical protein
VLVAGGVTAAGVTVLVTGVVPVTGVAVLVAGGVTATGFAKLVAGGVATLIVGIVILSVVACAGRLTKAQGIRHKLEIIKFLRDLLRVLSISNRVLLGGKNNFVVLEINTSTADILDCIQHTPI